MKNFFLFALLVISASQAGAQVTALDEHFNTFCVISGENYPTYWSEYDLYSNPLLAWGCDPTGGREGTPGIGCNNFDGTTYYVDTAWLFTPQLNLSYYTGNIFLNFDTKFTSNAGRLAFMISSTYVPGGGGSGEQVWSDISEACTPVLDNTGSTDWETHQVDLTPYAATPLYVSFRYTSDVTGSGKWLIDNVRTTQTVLGVAKTNNKILPLSVLGYATSAQITLSFSAPTAGQYQISVYDMVGRRVHTEEITAQAGDGRRLITGLSLNSGMYLVKMGNGEVYSTVKAIIP